jgi:hypothetical protein
MMAATSIDHTVGSEGRTGPVWRSWLVAWLGGAVIAIGNGTVRELVYKPYTGERPAHHISTALGIALLAVYMRAIDSRWPLPSGRSAMAIGASWLAMTVAFEFGFGRYVGGSSWEALLEQYDVTRGNVWVLVLLWVAAGPALIRALRTRGVHQPC